MTLFDLKIVASNRLFYQGKCQSITLPCTDGDKQVLAHHSAMLIAMTNGTLRFTDESGKETIAASGTGFAEVVDNQVTVVVDTVERPDEIDANRARAAAERAEERLRQKKSLQEYYKGQAALSRAMARLKVKK